MGKPAPKELSDAPVLSLEMSYLWRIFVELRNSSTNAISFQEMDAYVRLTGINLSPAEVDLIRELDLIHAKESQ